MTLKASAGVVWYSRHPDMFLGGNRPSDRRRWMAQQENGSTTRKHQHVFL